ncbi:MAG: hypothetical protein JKY02_08025 [Flavobacteriaceae bacterium]|nr:hypothetical protein [Flavobacteriaceae bacterium]
MKFKTLKNITTVFLLAASVVVVAQKQSKNFKESFKVNKDVTVEINATNAEIDVTTWNKNVVSVVASIEIEGLTKKEAEKYLKNYKFEALGNSSKVKITSRGNNSFRFSDNDFVIFNNDFVMPNIVIPEIPDFEMPEINFTMPDFDFDFDTLFMGLGDLEFDFDEYFEDGKEYLFQWKSDAREITIKSKKDWEKFKKSKEYKKFKKEMKTSKEKMKKELAKARKEIKGMDMSKIIRESLEKASESIREIDMKKINKELAKVRKEINSSFNNSFIFDTDSNEFTINNKKVKIKKKITIKVPKGATFNLNTRHCKVKLPKTKASGKVSYGTFNANGLNGGNLKIEYSPVNINTLNSSTLFLNNVTDAKVASVTNSNITSSSGKLTIGKVLSDVTIDLSFGDILISSFDSMLQNFKMDLKHSDATINATTFKNKMDIAMVYDSNGKKYDLLKKG